MHHPYVEQRSSTFFLPGIFLVWRLFCNEVVGMSAEIQSYISDHKLIAKGGWGQMYQMAVHRVVLGDLWFGECAPLRLQLWSFHESFLVILCGLLKCFVLVMPYVIRFIELSRT